MKIQNGDQVRLRRAEIPGEGWTIPEHLKHLDGQIATVVDTYPGGFGGRLANGDVASFHLSAIEKVIGSGIGKAATE